MAASFLKRAPKVEIEDVQGIILRGYSALKGSRFLALRIPKPDAARAWLGTIADRVTAANAGVTDRHVNVAFSFDALQRLGVPSEALTSFPPAFQQGMVGPERPNRPSHRSEILGDVGESAPESWRWGNAERPVDAALLLYTRSENDIDDFTEEHRSQLEKYGVDMPYAFETRELPGRKEHFGFRDGIAQPSLRNANAPAERPGVLEEGPARNTVEVGEFLLGYANHYWKVPYTPSVSADLDPDGNLLPLPGHRDRRDFGRNGSFLVWRQLAQDVQCFWRFVSDNAGNDPLERRTLAAKFVGRWPDGAPLVLSPHRDDPELRDADDFSYTEPDPDGLHCPFGSHIRRANPRDWHLAEKPRDAEHISQRHRIIRRGRPYGEPISPTLDPEEVLAAARDGVERGIHFLAFVADIERQFELVQQTWLGNRKFGDLYDETDPMFAEDGSPFTIQQTPVRRRLVRRRLDGLQQFVQVRGGGYFFMPGLRALRYLSKRPASPAG